MRRIKTTLAALALATALAGCGDATGPDGEATLQVAARGGGAAAAGPAGSTAPAFSQALGRAEGTVDFRARVYVQGSTGGWVELTRRAAQRVTVDASGRGEAATVATAGVEAGSYHRVRVVFEEVEAKLASGIHVGTGLLTGTVRVDLRSGGPVVVERSVDVGVSAGGTARLLVNLNADAWLGQASAQTGTVSEAAFASAVAVSVD